MKGSALVALSRDEAMFMNAMQVSTYIYIPRHGWLGVVPYLHWVVRRPLAMLTHSADSHHQPPTFYLRHTLYSSSTGI